MNYRLPSPQRGRGEPSGPGEGFQISTPLSGGDRKLAEHSGVGVVINSPPVFKEGTQGRLSPTTLHKFRPQIENIQARLRDLLPFIRDNAYHPNFQGSFSIKSVLPALIPEMTYEGMLIADGEQVGLARERIGFDSVNLLELP